MTGWDGVALGAVPRRRRPTRPLFVDNDADVLRPLRAARPTLREPRRRPGRQGLDRPRARHRRRRTAGPAATSARPARSATSRSTAADGLPCRCGDDRLPRDGRRRLGAGRAGCATPATTVHHVRDLVAAGAAGRRRAPAACSASSGRQLGEVLAVDRQPAQPARRRHRRRHGRRLRHLRRRRARDASTPRTTALADPRPADPARRPTATAPGSSAAPARPRLRAHPARRRRGPGPPGRLAATGGLEKPRARARRDISGPRLRPPSWARTSVGDRA